MVTPGADGPDNAPASPSDREKGPFGVTWLALAGALIWVFAALSWWTTSHGLLALMAAQGEAPLAETVVVFTLVGAFTLAMVFFVRTLFVPKVVWWVRIALFAGYLSTMALSVVFGFGYYWQWLASETETAQQMKEDTRRVSSELDTSLGLLQQASAGLGLALNHSQQQAALEDRQGTSCGVQAGAGQGPRFNLRTAEARYYREVSDAFQQDVSRLQSQQAELLTMVDQIQRGDAATGPAEAAKSADTQLSDQTKPGRDPQRVETVNRRIATLQESYNQVVEATKRRIGARPYGFTLGTQQNPIVLVDHPGFAAQAQRYGSQSEAFQITPGGEQFACPDTEMGRRLRNANDSIGNLEPRTFPVLTDYTSAVQSISTAFERLTVGLQRVVGLSVPPREDGSPRPGLKVSDLFPLGVAGIVDFMLLMMSLVHSALSPKPKDLDDLKDDNAVDADVWEQRQKAAEAARTAGSALSTADFYNAQAVMNDGNWNLLNRYSFRAKGNDFVAVPSQALTGEDSQIYNLMLIMRTMGRATVVSDPTRKGHRALRSNGISVRGGVTTYKLHPAALAHYMMSAAAEQADRIIDL